MVIPLFKIAWLSVAKQIAIFILLENYFDYDKSFFIFNTSSEPG